MNRENHARIKSQKNVDVGPAPKRPRRRRGLVAQSDVWIADHWPELAAAVAPTFADPPPSPFVELIARALTQYGEGGDLLSLEAPIVAPSSEHEAGRFGIFHPRTDRDAFIEALLGRTVPKSPRYRRDPPTVRVRVGSPEDLTAALGPVVSSLTKRTAGEQVRTAHGALADTLESALDDDQALAAITLRLLNQSPDAFASTPLGESLLRFKFDPIERDAARPSFEWQFVTLGAIAPGVVVGIAWWDPADHRARRHRAAVAAHLRYLFDHVVAPWNRWPDSRIRREAAAVATRPRASTVRSVAARLRREHGQEYAPEAERTTVARLYRLNGRLQDWRRTAFAEATALVGSKP